MPASESQVVVRNGFLEVVDCAEQKRPRAQTDCPVDSELRVFQVGTLSQISTRLKTEETSCRTVSEASTEVAGSRGDASAPMTARSNTSSDAICQPAVVVSEPGYSGMIFAPNFYDGASLVPMYQGESWAAPAFGTQMSPMEPLMEQKREQEHYIHACLPAWYSALPLSIPAPVPTQTKWRAASVRSGAFTTLMFRNLPVEYDRAMLLELLDAEGFAGLYDFVYLPADFRKTGCFGYCFINFVTTAATENFKQHFHGFNRWAVLSDRMAQVSISDPLQGLEAHIERYRDSPLMHESVPDVYRPVLFANGMRIAFPPPTKKLKAPRMRPAKGTGTA